MSVDPKITGRRIILENGKRVDDEDRKYLMHPRREEAKSVIRRNWYNKTFLDQGFTSECVVHSMDSYFTASPVRNVSFGSAQRRTQVYKEIQRNYDEWPGDDYDGTSVRGAAKWAKANGFISSYHWAFACEPIIDHILAETGGPVMMGTIWDDAMMETDKYGFIHSSQTEADDAGHAWVILGADREKIYRPTGDVGVVNGLTSWGPWGKRRNSRFYMTFKELDKLTKLEGEACIAIETKKLGIKTAWIGNSEEFSVA
jgi:hypothetical protein